MGAARGLEGRVLPAAITQFVDPHPAKGNNFGATIVPLSTGNVVITSPYDDAGGTDAGAVYLFNGTTGKVISRLLGWHANDRIGFSGITELANGNYLVRSEYWSNGSMKSAGAVTWCSGTKGLSGSPSSRNSLVGGHESDQIGKFNITVLDSGNYVVASPWWDNGSLADAGAVTWGSGSKGITGVISVSNSLVGTQRGDQVGGIYDESLFFSTTMTSSVVVLSNGNYLVRCPYWANGAATNAGAVTWSRGQQGIKGTINSSNSLVGSHPNDFVGAGEVTELTNGNYVVANSDWNSGRGAVTWGNGATGTNGEVSTANSLVGSHRYDHVGDSIVKLPNGNYLVASPDWSNGPMSSAGAVTWCSGTKGLSGEVSSANSLVGSHAGDLIGFTYRAASANFFNSGLSVVVLSNGNYVVQSPQWSNGSVSEAGAVTWGSGSTGITGVVSSSNSLIGSHTNDHIGQDAVYALTNGNYVVGSPEWDNGSTEDAGAVTWGDGAKGIAGLVSSSNSLVGNQADDKVGSSGITELRNGNYVIKSPHWNNYSGAITWRNGAKGTAGLVSSSNSLVGKKGDGIGQYDVFGYDGVTVLNNGNYVVQDRRWNNNAGAVAWADGTKGLSGEFNSTNSLIGSQGNGYGDRVGDSVVALTNGNYVVVSPYWNNAVGAVTWGNGMKGIAGLISSNSSLVGSHVGDRVGSGGFTALSNGNYVVNSPYWDNGATVDAGAVTWGNGLSGVKGVVSSTQSLIGSHAGDGIGLGGVTVLSNGNYVVISQDWNNGSNSHAGAVTWGNAATGVSGVVSAANSLVGSHADDRVGLVGIKVLNNGNYVVISQEWNNGSNSHAGAVTWGNAATGVSGAVSAANSLVGSHTDDRVGLGGITVLSNGNYVVISKNWNNGSIKEAGAVTWGNAATGISGAVSVANSLVGSSPQDRVGSGGVRPLPNGNYVVTSPAFSNAGLAQAGAVTPGNGLGGTVGVVNATNSLLGPAAGCGFTMTITIDSYGSRVIARFIVQGNGRVLIR